MAGKKQKNRPSDKEILALKRKLQAVTKKFFEKYGTKAGKRKKSGKVRKTLMAMDASAGGDGEGGIDFLLIGPPGPRPPPKLEIEILNLSSY